MSNDDAKYLTRKWALALALILIGWFSVRYVDTVIARINVQESVTNATCNRVTVLEANYQHIINGIAKLEKGQENLVEALKDHERSTAKIIKRGAE